MGVCSWGQTRSRSAGGVSHEALPRLLYLGEILAVLLTGRVLVLSAPPGEKSGFPGLFHQRSDKAT
jgi:hypothetical protein